MQRLAELAEIKAKQGEPREQARASTTAADATVVKMADGGYPAHDQLDGAAVGAWRQRMGTDPAKATYKDRAATAAYVNAQARGRGLTRLRVRGTAKVRCILLLHALAHHLMRTLVLAPRLMGDGEGAPIGIAVTT